MAKKSSGTSKSQAIRDYYEANPKAKPKQVASDLVAQGFDVTPQFVSTVRSNAKRKTKKKASRRGRPATKKTARRVGRPSGRTAGTQSEVSIDSLIKVKSIVDEMGSVNQARKALETLSKLRD